jgi:L-aspartate oxidase
MELRDRFDRDRIDCDRIDGIATADVLIVGTGIAGLTAALGCAPRRVTLLTKSRFGGGGSSNWAQGGIAVAVGADDAPALHAADTLAAGAGLNDPRIVDLLTAEGPRRIRRLLELGAHFDLDPEGHLSLGREAAHSRRRILHANGDATGAEIVRTLVAAVEQAPEIEVVEKAFAVDLVVERGAQGERVAGLLAVHEDGRRVLHLAPSVVLATGGLGRLYLHTTNPVEATGDGLAMALRAGAQAVDVEFVQFHPTALAAGGDPMPLVTEALRGEGAVLRDEAGERFMLAEHPQAELAPRDVVARAIWRRLEQGGRVFLDATAAVGAAFPERFPTVWASCREHGIDPRTEPIPVAPAAHYHMGGIWVDARGRTSLTGLWACGEVAATGAHGANRLASNSLLEALVFGARVAEDLWTVPAFLGPRALDGLALPGGGSIVEGAGDVAAARADDQAVIEAVRRLAWQKLGLVRDGAGLAAVLGALDRLSAAHPGVSGEARNLLCVARLVATAALARRESRGGHYRLDTPTPDPAWQRRLFLTAGPDGTIRIEAVAAPAAEVPDEEAAPAVLAMGARA